MQKMFQSATLKLTASYLAIIMAISITFSIVIYQLNYQEVNYRLESLQHSIVEQLDVTLPFNGYIDPYRVPGNPLETESQKASGQMILTLVYINAVIFLAGGLGSFLLARRTLRPIEEAHEAQSRFTSDASHELRTPLSAMKTELEVNLRDPNLALDEAKELLESNLEEVNKLIKLSETLLHLSRLDHHKLEMSNIDLSTLLEDVLKRYPSEAHRFAVTTRKHLRIRANEAAVEELMGILIDNALKYSPKKSTITMRTFTQRGMAGFEIKNTGKKIPEEKLPKLFDRFYRGDTSRTNSEKNGYGLGLSIAKKIVDLHHGYLSVSSSDAETTFTFLLPFIRTSSVKLRR